MMPEKIFAPGGREPAPDLIRGLCVGVQTSHCYACYSFAMSCYDSAMFCYDLLCFLLCNAMILLCSAKRADNGAEQDTVAPDAGWIFCQRLSCLS